MRRSCSSDRPGQRELASYETIKQLRRASTGPLTVDGGLLTPTLKVRRKKVYEAFRDASFEALYA